MKPHPQQAVLVDLFDQQAAHKVNGQETDQHTSDEHDVGTSTVNAGMNDARDVVWTRRDQADGEDGQDREKGLGLDHAEPCTTLLLMLPPKGGEKTSDNALSDHRVGDLAESGHVRTEHVVAFAAVFLGGGGGVLVNADHDLLETRVDFLSGPRQAERVL